MPPRAIKHQLTCPFELTSGSFLIGRRRILVIPRNNLVIKAMLPMLGGGENVSENLSGCYLPLGYHCIREWGETELVSVRSGRLPVGVPANALAHRLLNYNNERNILTKIYFYLQNHFSLPSASMLLCE